MYQSIHEFTCIESSGITSPVYETECDTPTDSMKVVNSTKSRYKNNANTITQTRVVNQNWNGHMVLELDGKKNEVEKKGQEEE